ncbi:17039_t:CDS:1, partial [Racocetra fulgida]
PKEMVLTNTNLFYIEKTDPHETLSSTTPKNKAKKTRERNPRTKSVYISKSPNVISFGSIQTRPTPENLAKGTQ